jgi:hypothetical protein
LNADDADSNIFLGTIMIRFIHMVMLATVLSTAGYCQTLTTNDSLINEKKAGIRIKDVYTLKEGSKKSYYKPSAVEFVDSAGNVIKELSLPEEIKKEISFDFDQNKRTFNAYVQNHIETMNASNTFIAINTIKTEIKDKQFYDSIGYYGIQRVDIVVFAANGIEVFKQGGVPYHISAISEDGSKFCCNVPEPENYTGDAFCPIRDFRSDKELLTKGKIMVIDRQGKVLYQEYKGNADGLFSPDGNWFLSKTSAYSGTLVYFIDMQKTVLKQNLSDRARRELKAIEPSHISRIDNEGNVYFTASFERKRPYRVFWLKYNPSMDKISQGNFYRLVE